MYLMSETRGIQTLVCLNAKPMLLISVFHCLYVLPFRRGETGSIQVTSGGEQEIYNVIEQPILPVVLQEALRVPLKGSVFMQTTDGISTELVFYITSVKQLRDVGGSQPH